MAYKPLRRTMQSRGATARRFNKSTRKTKAANLNGLARGGWRL